VRSLEAGFLCPPDDAKPRVWWHWMNGNVSKEGITADLEAMAAAGIGGAHVFDVGCNVPGGPVKFNTSIWDEHIRFAAKEAERLGLELTLVNCSGYANAGGPWVVASNSMFMVSLTEARLVGGRHVAGVIKRDATDDNGFYRDIACLAFPVPKAEIAKPEWKGGYLATNVVVLSAKEPSTVRSFSFTAERPGWSWRQWMTVTVSTSDDGRTWTEKTRVTEQVVDGDKSDCLWGRQRTIALPEPVTARHVRFDFDFSRYDIGETKGMWVVNFTPRAKRTLPDLSGRLFVTATEVGSAPDVASADEVLDASKMIDLTDRMDADGRLVWDVPAGEWLVFRVGYRSAGIRNHPASDYGGGYEVDKLDADAVRRHYEAYAGRFTNFPAVKAVLCDSYEVGPQNWTHGLEKQLAARLGRSFLPYLAAWSGRAVGSIAETDGALREMRRLISDLFCRNFARTFAVCGRKDGIRSAFECYGNMSADALAYGWEADIPMCEFWVTDRSDAVGYRTNSYARLARICASAAHLRGCRQVDCEAFTAFPDESGRWLKTPFDLKAVGDVMYAAGVNRMVYHRWAHQPWVTPPRYPGMTMGQWGTHFERTETWWPMVKPWLRYQARCQFLLQEGVSCADALVFAGDGVPNAGEPEVEPDCAWDVCSGIALRTLRVEKGRLVAPSGATYAALVVPTNRFVSVESQRKIDALVAAGARTVRSGDPLGLPADFTVLHRQPPTTNHQLPTLSWLHRRAADGRDIYFVAQPTTNEQTLVCSFRQTGRVPQLWDAETGLRMRPRACREADGRTEVTIDFRAAGSLFVVFADAEDKSLPVARAPQAFDGAPFEVETEIAFPVDWYTGGTAVKTVRQRGFPDWTGFADDDLRYFSGVATYRFDVSETGVIDFGDVRNVADVFVDGVHVKTLWRPPYRCTVPKGRVEVRVANLWVNRLIGDERLPSDREWNGKQLKEIPAWVREGCPSPTGRKTFTTWHHWKSEDALRPSGILGPVRFGSLKGKE